MKFHRQTRKRYYENGYLSQCQAAVVKIEADMIELDSTVAFPEGGGRKRITVRSRWVVAAP